MISKNKIKYIHSLALKKVRKAECAYVAEGPKTVGDLLRRQKARTLVATGQWIADNGALAANTNELITVDDEELRKTSLLQTPQQVIGIFDQTAAAYDFSDIDGKLTIALDGVQDPGNLGTIIRIADWFGIDTIVCSHDTADAYNPKTVQATMGSIARVRVVYTDLAEAIRSLPDGYPVFATLLDGDNIYATDLPPSGMIVMGNEGNGISREVRSLITNKILIPDFATSSDKAESLNVAIATAITCSEFRRTAYAKVN